MAFLERLYKFKSSRIVNKNAAPTVLTSGGDRKNLQVCRNWYIFTKLQF
jgi:hypothetical protein